MIIYAVKDSNTERMIPVTSVIDGRLQIPRWRTKNVTMAHEEREMYGIPAEAIPLYVTWDMYVELEQRLETVMSLVFDEENRPVPEYDFEYPSEEDSEGETEGTEEEETDSEHLMCSD